MGRVGLVQTASGALKGGHPYSLIVVVVAVTIVTPKTCKGAAQA